MSQIRKQAFWEIGSGKLGRQLQDEYEQACIDACEANQKVKVKLEILITPPRRDNIGDIQFAISHTVPAYKSIAYEAEFDHMVVIATADPDIGVLQESLALPDTIQHAHKEAVNAGE